MNASKTLLAQTKLRERLCDINAPQAANTAKLYAIRLRESARRSTFADAYKSRH
jgi:hypothetical protein